MENGICFVNQFLESLTEGPTKPLPTTMRCPLERQSKTQIIHDIQWHPPQVPLLKCLYRGFRRFWQLRCIWKGLFSSRFFFLSGSWFFVVGLSGICLPWLSSRFHLVEPDFWWAMVLWGYSVAIGRLLTSRGNKEQGLESKESFSILRNEIVVEPCPLLSLCLILQESSNHLKSYSQSSTCQSSKG